MSRTARELAADAAYARRLQNDEVSANHGKPILADPIGHDHGGDRHEPYDPPIDGSGGVPSAPRMEDMDGYGDGDGGVVEGVPLRTPMPGSEDAHRAAAVPVAHVAEPGDGGFRAVLARRFAGSAVIAEPREMVFLKIAQERRSMMLYAGVLGVLQLLTPSTLATFAGVCNIVGCVGLYKVELEYIYAFVVGLIATMLTFAASPSLWDILMILICVSVMGRLTILIKMLRMLGEEGIAEARAFIHTPPEDDPHAMV